MESPSLLSLCCGIPAVVIVMLIFLTPQEQLDVLIKDILVATNQIPSDEEKYKRVDIDDFEDEKPKRLFDEPEPSYAHFIVGDDGELLEVIDDKPKRGESYDG